MYHKISRQFTQIPQLSSRDISYQSDDHSLKPFYLYSPELDSFREVIAAKKKFKTDRGLLVSQISKQYEDKDTHDQVHGNIAALSDENTFTVITAHQPVLLLGPLYFIYKIASVLSLSKQLNEAYPEYQIVPVFVLGGEDHDFDEIASCHLFNKTFTWESNQKGAVGRMHLDDLESTIEDVLERFGQSTYAGEMERIIRTAFKAANNYGDFIFRLVNTLFGAHGLVTVNTDNTAFKQAFAPYILKDLEEMTSHKMVNKDQRALEKAGFKPQALAREVNLFFHGEDRNRILHGEHGIYEIGEETYNLEDIKDLVRSQPENISPNVVLRPLYQEVIFPNLAYIGGGGELAYWMERKSMFEAFKVPFPMLIRRDSFLIVDRRSIQNLDQLGLDLIDLFEREEQIVNQYALAQASTEINLEDAKKRLRDIFEDIGTLSKDVDATLYKSVMGECAKAEKIIEYLESKLLKAEKRKRSTELNKIVKLKNKFFPNNDGLQERYDNFIPYFLRYGPAWIEEIILHANPLDKNFKILVEE